MEEPLTTREAIIRTNPSVVYVRDEKTYRAKTVACDDRRRGRYRIPKGLSADPRGWEWRLYSADRGSYDGAIKALAQNMGHRLYLAFDRGGWAFPNRPKSIKATCEFADGDGIIKIGRQGKRYGGIIKIAPDGGGEFEYSVAFVHETKLAVVETILDDVGPTIGKLS